jgi:hypothetical protein
MGERPNGRDEYEEWPSEPPPNHVEDQGPNVLRLYLAGAPKSGNEMDCATILAPPTRERATPPAECNFSTGVVRRPLFFKS